MFNLLLTVSMSLSQFGEHNTNDLRDLVDFRSSPSRFVWKVVNDDVMGGRSTGYLAVSNGLLQFRGELNTNGGGFASIRTEPAALDIGTHDGLKLKVRGDGRTYKLRVATTGSDFAYMAEFPTRRGEWVIIDLPFSTFLPSSRGRKLDRAPVVPSEITTIGLLIADKLDGEFALDVEWIRLNPAAPQP